MARQWKRPSATTAGRKADMIGVRVTPKVKEALELLAKAERRTLSNLVGVILEKFVMDQFAAGKLSVLADLIRHTDTDTVAEMASELHRDAEGPLPIDHAMRLDAMAADASGSRHRAGVAARGDPGLLDKLIPRNAPTKRK
jgi:hypothetical protein